MLSVPNEDYTGPNSAWKQQLQFSEPAAQQMFAAIKSDTPYTAKKSSSGSTKTGSTASAPASPNASAPNASNVLVSTVHAQVENGSGTNGRAAVIKQALVSSGFSSANVTTATATTQAKTVLNYPASRADSAAAVAAALGIPSSAMHESADSSVVTVVIGQDWTTGTALGPIGTAGSPTGVASSAPSSSLQTNGADTKACMYVQSPEW
jgi:hypothetical protein